MVWISPEGDILDDSDPRAIEAKARNQPIFGGSDMSSMINTQEMFEQEIQPDVKPEANQEEQESVPDQPETYPEKQENVDQNKKDTDQDKQETAENAEHQDEQQTNPNMQENAEQVVSQDEQINDLPQETEQGDTQEDQPKRNIRSQSTAATGGMDQRYGGGMFSRGRIQSSSVDRRDRGMSSDVDSIEYSTLSRQEAEDQGGIVDSIRQQLSGLELPTIQIGERDIDPMLFIAAIVTVLALLIYELIGLMSGGNLSIEQMPMFNNVNKNLTKLKYPTKRLPKK